MVSESLMRAKGFSKAEIETYQLFHGSGRARSIESKKDLAWAAGKLGVSSSTVRCRLSRAHRKLQDPASIRSTRSDSDKQLEQKKGAQVADAIVGLSDPLSSVAEVARETGLGPQTVNRIQARLDGELQPLARVLEDVRVEDLMKRFGTLSKAAIDAITPEKLEGATAQQLAVIAGIAADKWQLLRGMPTQRLEIHDRRKMDELVGAILQEARRRNIEIDVTPDGEINAKRSPYRSAAHRDLMKQIETGDPPETYR